MLRKCHVIGLIYDNDVDNTIIVRYLAPFNDTFVRIRIIYGT